MINTVSLVVSPWVEDDVTVMPRTPLVIARLVMPIVADGDDMALIPGNVTNAEPDEMVVVCGMLAKVRVKLIMPPAIGVCPVSPTK